MSAPLNLEVVEGPDAGLQVPVQGSLLIGREADVDVHLNDPRVSRRHARITPSGGEVSVEDLGSANGTFVNHEQLHGPALLAPGGELVIGTSVLALRTSEQVAARPSAVRAVPPALAAPPREPTYVSPASASAPPAPAPGPPELARLLDVRVRAQARLAPLAMLLVVAIALVLYFALR